MKKALILNWIMFFSLILLIILHTLTLISVLPTEILWDTSLQSDPNNLIIAEAIILAFLITLAFIYRNFLLRFKSKYSRLSIKRILVIIAIFSVLEILGAAIGISTEYKVINLGIYSYFFIFSVFCFTRTKVYRRPKNKLKLQVKNAHV